MNSVYNNKIIDDPSGIVNIHVHLPLLGDEIITNLKKSPHALIPSELIDAITDQVKPETFFSQFPGKVGLFAVERHNIFGELCPIYMPNQYVLELAGKYPDRVIPFCSLDLHADNADRELDDLIHMGFVGVKYHALEGYSLTDPRCTGALSYMNRVRIPLVVHLGDTPFPEVNLENAHPQIVLKIADRYPEIPILITHFATPLHFHAYWVLSRYDNVYLDTSEYPIYWTPHRDNPYGPLLSPMHIKRIGVHKVIFGTDFPMPTLMRIDTKPRKERRSNTDGQLSNAGISPVSSENDEDSVYRYEVRLHDIEYYLSEFLGLPEYYFSDEEKRRILYENVWEFLGKSPKDVESSNKRI